MWKTTAHTSVHSLSDEDADPLAEHFKSPPSADLCICAAAAAAAETLAGTN